MKEVIKTKWRGWWLHNLQKQRQCNTKRWQCYKKKQHQGDAMQPTHIDKNKQLEWVKNKGNRRMKYFHCHEIIKKNNHYDDCCFDTKQQWKWTLFSSPWKKMQNDDDDSRVDVQKQKQGKKIMMMQHNLQTTMTHANKQKRSKSWKNTKRIWHFHCQTKTNKLTKSAM